MDECGFIVMTPLGFRVVCTAEDWERIAGRKLPPLRGRLREVVETLSNPDEIRRSVSDPEVTLFHLWSGRRWVCAVIRRSHPESRLITAYPADKIKQGALLWRK